MKFSVVIFLCLALLGLRKSRGAGATHLPNARRFIQLPGSYALNSRQYTPLLIRVQQFNVLADGLAGMREDLGGFSRVDRSILDWNSRKDALLHEMLQYNADVITIQECDHFYDFFLPEMSSRGYTGYFAPKPTSACLEVTGNNDGCAMFIKKDRLRVVSCEAKTLALSIAKLSDGGELQEDEKNIKLQNQVALIAVCEFVGWPTKNGADRMSDLNKGYKESSGSANKQADPPPLLIGTAHLKSSKSAVGERYRQKGALQILTDLSRIYNNFARAGRPPAVILTGDFNAISEDSPLPARYAPLTYRALKLHSLGLRSVYNDDLPLSPVKSSSPELYTTWKARRKDGTERVIKRCIDYIFYAPFRVGPPIPRAIGDENNTKSPIIAKSTSQVVISLLLRSAVYAFGATIPIAALFDSGLAAIEKISISLLGILGLGIFELTCTGSIFKPEVQEDKVIESIDSEVLKVDSELQALSAAGKAISTSRGTGKEILKKVKTISKQLQSPTYGRPGMQAVAALDLFSEEEIGPQLMPSSTYPSDHLSIAADLEILWT